MLYDVECLESVDVQSIDFRVCLKCASRPCCANIILLKIEKPLPVNAKEKKHMAVFCFQPCFHIIKGKAQRKEKRKKGNSKVNRNRLIMIIDLKNHLAS